MKIKLTIFLLIIALPVFAVPQKTNYKGYKHKGVVYGETLPNGVKDLGGGLLSNENYGVSRFSKGKKNMLWLEKVTGRDEKGVPSWQVKDVLMFDQLKKNQEFLFSYSSTCTQNGKATLDLVVMAELSVDKKSYKIIDAWKANVKKEKFEKVSADKIECEVGTR
ncbi:MAG: hypothetical protein JWN60_2946 [Acidobacteria bacterium]|jgi:hypothetical protein|nr:hypothetical protein [Acidobacteriota bacterium]